MATMNVARTKLSPKTKQLHQILKESLNMKDRQSFAQALEFFKQDKNLEVFVKRLDKICSTAQQKQEIYPLLREFIPRKQRATFDYECGRPRISYDQYKYHTYSQRQLQRSGYYGSERSLLSESQLGHRRTLSVDSGFDTPVPSSRKFENRKVCRKKCAEKYVYLERDDDEFFGFSIRGGAEHNVALYVSSIDEGSIAEQAGLSLGDQILQANEVDFTNFDHGDAVEIIKQSRTLHLFVKCVGKIPGMFKSSSSYRWIDPLGNEVSPPAQYNKSGSSGSDLDKSDLRLLARDDEKKVNLFVADGAKLGLKIRGGIEHGLGIFIASVDSNSGAQRAGLQVGDQILDVNGKSLVNISHSEAVRVLKSSQHMVITLKEVGVLPHGKKIRDETKWVKDGEISPRETDVSLESSKERNAKPKKVPSFHDPLGSSLRTHHSVADHSGEILRMKATQVLSNNELQSFSFYLEEYRKARLSLISFLSALTDLLKTPTKETLLEDIRSAILPRDLPKFDNFVDTRDDRSTREDMGQRRGQEVDRQSLCSNMTYSSTNSWLGYFENGALQQDLKNSIRSRFSASPRRPPLVMDEHGWDVASIGSRSSRARRALPYDDFPPPPKFIQDHGGDTDTSIDQHGPQERTISPSDIRLDGSFDQLTTPHQHGASKTGPLSCKGDQEFTDSDPYEIVDYDVKNRLGKNKSKHSSFDSNGGEDDGGVHERRDFNMFQRSGETLGDDPYTAVDGKTTRTTEMKQENVDDLPIYAVVDKEKKTSTNIVECDESGPPIPPRLFLDSVEDGDQARFTNDQLPPPIIGDMHLSNGDIPKPQRTKEKDNTSERVETNNNVKQINTGSSTKRSKKSKKSRSNIMQEPNIIDSDHFDEPFVVELSKHANNLGLTIKGGIDTGDKEIRIKSIKDGTVASGCPLLKPGQIILGVDEKSLLNVTSGIATMAIRQAFHSDKPILKLILENDR